jgi:hypothetical protein
VNRAGGRRQSGLTLPSLTQSKIVFVCPVSRRSRSREFRSGCGMPDRGDAAFHLATIDLAD